MNLQNGYDFWSYHPALFYGISMLLGVFASFNFNLLIALAIFLTISPFLFIGHYSKVFLFLFIFFASFFYSYQNNNHPEIPLKGCKGLAYIQFESLSKKDTFKGVFWHYQGKIVNFKSEHTNCKNINFSMDIPDKDDVKRVVADQDYLIEGRLKKLKNGKYCFVPNLKADITAVNSTYSAAEWRFQLKEKLKKTIARKIGIEPSASFLSGITTGLFENRLLSFEFSRFGLQHIMAISGFHFTLLTSIFAVFLSLLFKREIVFCLLIVLCTFYFLFLGITASIVRAWICSTLGLVALLLNKQPSALNALGVALISALIINPEFAFELGFQFSFLITAAIVIGNNFFDRKLQFFVTKRSFADVLSMNTTNQLGFIFISWIRKFIALSFCINLVAIPLSLYYFERFPLLSLIYNFFIPLMVSFSLFLLILAFILDILTPTVGSFLHSFNALYTNFMIDYTYYLPQKIDLHLNFSLDSSYLTALFLFFYSYVIYGIKVIEYKEEKF